jgi:DNA-binding Lrp family transcriptional regulator
MAVQQGGMLSPDQLNDTDERLLDLLTEGRITPRYAADELEISRPYASSQLKRLVEHGHVEKIAPGLYELADDPRE